MSVDETSLLMGPEGARAPVAGPGRECPGCGAPLTERQKVCSGKCRAKLSRQRKADELRSLLLNARPALDAAIAAVSNPTPRQDRRV